MRKFLFFAAITMMFTSCRFFGGERVRGNGVIKNETRTTGNFKSVRVSSNVDLYLSQDSTHAVKIEADENLQSYIEVSNDGDELVIRTREGYNLKGTKGIKAYISAPLFTRIEASGACDIFSEKPITQPEALAIEISGSSQIKLDIRSPKVTADCSGSGDVQLKGETKDLSVSGSGSTSINSKDMMAENVDVEISGSGDADVYASVKLNVDISGSADVKYRGNAAVKQSISGSGSITKVQ